MGYLKLMIMGMEMDYLRLMTVGNENGLFNDFYRVGSIFNQPLLKKLKFLCNETCIYIHIIHI